MEFPRQEYWSGLPFLTPEDLPNPEIKLASLAFPALAGGLFTTSATRRASLVAQLVKNLPAMQGSWFDSLVGKIHWRRNRLPTPVFSGFPGGSAGKESACNVGDLGSIAGWEDPLEKEMATHSSIFIWTIPWTEEPGWPQSMESESNATLAIEHAW